MTNNNDSPFNAQDIVKRAKLAMNFKTDSELAAHLGVSRSTLSNWCTRNSIDFPLILSRLSEVDYNWLLTGKGNPVHQPQMIETELVSGEVEVIHNPKTVEAIGDRCVPLYDINAAANLKTMLADGPQYKMGDIQIPGVPRCDGALFVSGDSMYPLLKSGDIVGFKEISSLDNIIFGEIYLISFQLEGDEYLSVKFVKGSEREGYIKLVSYNDHHAPKDIPLACVHSMAIVKFSIRRLLMM